ncbi:PREDICTED: uncharacterized protein LOC106746993 [Dinoponera quadriceps]|uniref:Uncharacterized protein LOC106746993 n=1 Tax=Dinoponera quadriceps TaxID=609295 RepID=A0A6P3XMK8_DINQU|nr:PREDICTED: uncharacterized protein LOC106746993 [Dinoponera quadriceps]
MSCFGGHDEQIYLIEILIDRLTLTPGKIKDIGGHPIVIKIKLLDLPVFEITRDQTDASKAELPQDGSVRFAAGKCCLFVKQPRDLVRDLRSTSLRAGVFRADDTYPTAETELTLPGCLCDQVAMIGNDPGNLPRPFTVKGGFHLLDPGENPSGTLHMELTITCLGRLYATRHELHPKSPVLAESEDKERELYVKRYVPPEFLPQKEALPEVAPIVEKAKPEKAKKGKGKKKKKK